MFDTATKRRIDTARDSLVAVISLPVGCFQPYSGVKTSILILDKSLARQSDSIGFFKVENDGYGLSAQRRAVEGEQLTQVKTEISVFLQAIRSGVFRANGLVDLRADGPASSQPGAPPQVTDVENIQGLKARPNRASANGAGLQPSNHLTDTGPGALPQADIEHAVGAEFTCGLIVVKKKIAANGELITRFEQKIQATRARVWGDKGGDRMSQPLSSHPRPRVGRSTGGRGTRVRPQGRKVLRFKKSNAFQPKTFASFASPRLCAGKSPSLHSRRDAGTAPTPQKRRYHAA